MLAKIHFLTSLKDYSNRVLRLGLVIYKGIVDAHGGKIWLDKSYRGGTAIKFTLPQKGKQGDGGDMDVICECC